MPELMSPSWTQSHGHSEQRMGVNIPEHTLGFLFFFFLVEEKKKLWKLPSL